MQRPGQEAHTWWVDCLRCLVGCSCSFSFTWRPDTTASLEEGLLRTHTQTGSRKQRQRANTETTFLPGFDKSDYCIYCHDMPRPWCQGHPQDGTLDVQSKGKVLRTFAELLCFVAGLREEVRTTPSARSLSVAVRALCEQAQLRCSMQRTSQHRVPLWLATFARGPGPGKATNLAFPRGRVGVQCQEAPEASWQLSVSQSGEPPSTTTTGPAVAMSAHWTLRFARWLQGAADASDRSGGNIRNVLRHMAFRGLHIWRSVSGTCTHEHSWRPTSWNPVHPGI